MEIKKFDLSVKLPASLFAVDPLVSCPQKPLQAYAQLATDAMIHKLMGGALQRWWIVWSEILQAWVFIAPVE